jgi:hypothetical protein
VKHKPFAEKEFEEIAERMSVTAEKMFATAEKT